MENASKALIIAGTILITLLGISAGMYLFSGAGGLGKTVTNSWSQDEVLAFNQKFLKFEGEQKGSRVKELIAAVNKSNQETDVKVKIENGNFVTGNENSGYYATAKLINANTYNIKLEYTSGIIANVIIE